MGMYFAHRDGLWMLADAWRQVACPLEGVDFAAFAEGHIAAVDDRAHRLCLDGRLLPCPRDVEALLLWQEHALVLSSNTDCLSIAGQDGWLVTARVGMCPQDLCLLGDTVLVCGGADGLIHRLTLPDLLPVGTYTVPGIALRIDAAADTAFVLCTDFEDGLCTRCCRLELRSGRCEPITTLPGVPGTIRADGRSGVWAAVSDVLYHFPEGCASPDGRLDGFGLIRHIDVQEDLALITDPVAERCVLVTADLQVLPLWEGEISQAGFLGTKKSTHLAMSALD